jgi:hypothetical protein
MYGILEDENCKRKTVMPRRIRFTRERRAAECRLWRRLIEESNPKAKVFVPRKRVAARENKRHGLNTNLESFAARWARAA